MRIPSQAEREALKRRLAIAQARNRVRESYKLLIKAHEKETAALSAAFVLADRDIKTITGVN
jgi:hypothetical protein